MHIYIIFSGAMLEHWGTAEVSQSLYLQVHKIVPLQFLCHQR
jgi:hypothetical protein